MTRWHTILALTLMVFVGVSSLAVIGTRAQTQMPAPAPGQKAGDFFKNVTTSTLKDLSVDDFVASMGVISAALGFDCSDCHPGAGTDRVNWVIDTPFKRTARQMVGMVATINRSHFSGVQKVTCWTCHHGREKPATSVMLDNWYDAPNMELDDLVVADRSEPSADQVFDKYVQALGGADKLKTLTSWIATGTSIGYGGLGGNAVFTAYAKAPNQHATRITFKDHPERPNSVWAFNGRAGWISTPRGLLQGYELAGSELDGARFEAQLAFPGQIKQILNDWRVGQRRIIGERSYVVVQGNGPRGFLATLYFDPDSGLLTRMVRYGSSPIGHLLTQVDYGDYRDVGGIKFPFELKFTWLDGRYTAKLTDIKVNASVDDSVFGRPQ
jgi:hypothetical protein